VCLAADVVFHKKVKLGICIVPNHETTCKALRYGSQSFTCEHIIPAFTSYVSPDGATTCS